MAVRFLKDFIRLIETGGTDERRYFQRSMGVGEWERNRGKKNKRRGGADD